jgi:hypothetical protein
LLAALCDDDAAGCGVLVVTVAACDWWRAEGADGVAGSEAPPDSCLLVWGGVDAEAAGGSLAGAWVGGAV